MQLRQDGKPGRAMVSPVNVNVVRDKLLAVGSNQLFLIRDSNMHLAKLSPKEKKTRCAHVPAGRKLHQARHWRDESGCGIAACAWYVSVGKEGRKQQYFRISIHIETMRWECKQSRRRTKGRREERKSGGHGIGRAVRANITAQIIQHAQTRG